MPSDNPKMTKEDTQRAYKLIEDAKGITPGWFERNKDFLSDHLQYEVQLATMIAYRERQLKEALNGRKDQETDR